MIERRQSPSATVSAAVVIGLEPGYGAMSLAALQAVAERLERSVRPWDTVVPLAPGVIGVVCTALTGLREVEAVATRLADAVRAPIAVDDAIHQLGACHGAATMLDDEDQATTLGRAQAAMQLMRDARVSLLGDEESPTA